ncbi:uncharacterized protein [Spinacia oleracea]|uniref:Transposase-associated domain-containing protein n=1 Tax=Spinacia oleracea TaxID=3562 RepID=A0ABM3QXU4_SPIOL|nr:uncharacterized protein LOC130463150 [Spinacia oleracea]
MDRNWMYGSRTTNQYILGVEEFIACAVAYQLKNGDESILCPCSNCDCSRRFRNVDQIREHLVRRGFRLNYTRWIWHGESVNHGECNINYGHSGSNFGGDNDIHDDDNGSDDMDNDELDYVEDDEINEMMQDVEDYLNDQPSMYENLSSAASKPLYPGCSKYSILSAMLKLYNKKAKYNWCDQSFTSLLEDLKDMFPEGNEIPISNYRAKKMLCPMGIEYQKIHACPNDCILYRKEYQDLHKCPRCGLSRYKRKKVDGTPDEKGPPAKVLWYLPIIPRFKRLFANKKEAKNLRWHEEGRKKDEYLRHPADSPQWKNFDEKFDDFGKEMRNLRLGLCTDGMNPFGTLSTQHSTWPVLLSIYNLPPWLCMKRKYIMLSLLISGPKQPGNDIDVYLAPLIDDLKVLWNEGVPVFDSYTETNFTLRAMIFCTVNDFPAYGNLSGYINKGAKACPICEDDMVGEYLEHCKKNIYWHTRRLLPLDHPYRKKKKPFNGKTEVRVARPPLTGSEVYERVKDINTVYGKPYKAVKGALYKKKSPFWDLPYWRHLEVRHCLDFMHVEKNVFESIIGTLLNITGKTKDGENVRKDMQKLKIRPELAPEDKEKGKYLPPACYTMSKNEKISFFECLRGIKVPSGYSSNIKRLVSKNELKMVGMKSHDCHVMMQQFLPIAIRGILPKHVRNAITRLCFFFNAICSKEIDPSTLDDLQSEVIVTLCQFEMYFPPSFFDIMVHVVVHLVQEIKICGPVWARNMYPFERHLGTLQDKVRNRYYPEGSIIEGTIAEEIMGFVAQYLAGLEPVGLSKSRHEERLEGHGIIGHKRIVVDRKMKAKAHLYVLQHLSKVQPYIDDHMAYLKEKNPLKDDQWLAKEHNDTFIAWFQVKVMSQRTKTPKVVCEMIKWLAYGPELLVDSYEGYDINGYTFYTERQDAKSVNQNSGVSVVASSIEYANAKDTSPLEVTMPYYGVIEDIWELDYTKFRIPLFRCKWVDNGRGVRRVEDGYTQVDFKRLGHQNEPFIMASQVKQVFYIVDPKDKKKSIVVQGKRRILGIGDVEDEEEYDQFDEDPPLSNGLPKSNGEDAFDANYMRSDHCEGLWVEKSK